MTTTDTPRQLTFEQVRTYTTAMLFIVGNLLLPQLFHLFKMGGPTWLPLYFFTLTGSAMYGWRVGLLTALASPLINSLLFGMPVPAVLPAIMVKSVLLAMFAACAVRRFRVLTLAVLAGVVLSYQAVGTLAEWLLCGDFALACQDFRIGVPGMLLQIVGGWALLKVLHRGR